MRLALVTVLGMLVRGSAFGVDMGTAFTVQGRLVRNSVPVTDDSCVFTFTLWDAPAAGNQVGVAPPAGIVEVTTGVFTKTLDFGAAAINGQARWLQIVVECPDDVGPVTLLPRTPLTPAPHALALPGLRTEQNTTCPNLIGGSHFNIVTMGAVGATIGGGGGNLDRGFDGENRVYDNYGTIGGGAFNLAGNEADDLQDSSFATVGGGANNTANGNYSTVGGGWENGASNFSTVGGGSFNGALGSDSTVSGGDTNTASGVASTVPGGILNVAGGSFSFAAGRRAKVRDAAQVGGGDSKGDEGTFVWADSTNADFQSTGPNQFLIRASGGVGIGTPSPEGTLHVHRASAGAATATSSAVLVLEHNSDMYVNLLSPDANERGILFGAPNGNAHGQIIYNDTLTPSGFQFRTNNSGTPKMVIESGGDVGIGTSAPASLLHLAQSGSPTLRWQDVDAGGPTYHIGIAASDDTLRIAETGIADRIILQRTTGNVGIGTAAPMNKLDVEGSVAIGSDFSGLEAAPANGLIVQGDVGIGTDAPLGALHVTNGDTIIDSLTSKLRIRHPTTGDGWGFGTTGGGETLLIQELPSGGGTTNRVAIDFGGNVGIGLTDPNVSLNLSGSGADVTLGAGTGDLAIGNVTGANLILDENEIQARSNGAAAALAVNRFGGQVFVGPIAFPPSAMLNVAAGGGSVVRFDRLTNDGAVVEIAQGGTIEGGISVSGTTVSYVAFTGSHFAWTETALERGTLVSLTGDNRRKHDDAGAEPIYGIEPARRANDPHCLGSYLGLLEPLQSHDSNNPHQVMAVGNGDMWVIATDRDIEPGDYLISSEVSGHAMLDDEERFEVGHVVARAAEPVDWSTVTDAREGCKHKRISVFFESFVRGNSRHVQRKLQEKDRQIDRLQQQNQEILERLAGLEALLESSNGLGSGGGR
jgi:hypothetical protein